MFFRRFLNGLNENNNWPSFQTPYPYSVQMTLSVVPKNYRKIFWLILKICKRKSTTNGISHRNRIGLQQYKTD